MRTLALACVLFAAVGCIRDNPDFSSEPGPLPSTSNGPASDLASNPPADLGVAPTADLSTHGPDPVQPDMAVVGPGGGMGDPDPGIACGNQSCDLPNVCCAKLFGASCIAPGEMCSGGKSVACDGPEDCDDGNVCCSGLSGTSCQDHCMGDSLCHTNDDCKDNNHCCPTLTGYPVCRSFGC